MNDYRTITMVHKRRVQAGNARYLRDTFFFFNSLDEDRMNKVMPFVRERVMRPQEKLLIDGMRGRCFFAVKQGSVVAQKNAVD